MKLYSTANVNIATCVHVQYIETRDDRFEKRANKPEKVHLGWQ